MKNSIKNNRIKGGRENMIDYYKSALENDTFFPNGVHINNMDMAVKKFFNKEFVIVSGKEHIPTFDIFSIQRYEEFTKIWLHTDEHKQVKMPLLTLVRDDNKKGTNLGSTFNIPGSRSYTLWKRPVLKNGRKSVEYYNIPQPVPIDIVYNAHIYTEFLSDINSLDEFILQTFKSSQKYILVNGHYMPLKLESMQDASNISNIDERRFYHKSYTLVLKGYLLDETQFKKLSSVDKINIKFDTDIKSSAEDCIFSVEEFDCDMCLNFKFKRKAPKSKTIIIPKDIEFTYDNQSNSNYSYFLNNELVTLPFVAKANDKLTLAHNINYQAELNIKVCGSIL